MALSAVGWWVGVGLIGAGVALAWFGRGADGRSVPEGHARAPRPAPLPRPVEPVATPPRADSAAVRSAPVPPRAGATLLPFDDASDGTPAVLPASEAVASNGGDLPRAPSATIIAFEDGEEG